MNEEEIVKDQEELLAAMQEENQALTELRDTMKSILDEVKGKK